MERPLTNAEIARKLLDIRVLMEFAGEPFFKFMAYERAASAVENAAPVADLIAAEELQKLPGVGKTIAGRIAGDRRHRDERVLRGVCGQYPPTLIELLHVQGVGIGTAFTLHADHGIASLAD